MTEKEYRSHPAVSRSELWWLEKSPEWFRFKKDHPTAPTPALLFGQVVHKLLLEPETFGEDFIVAPDVDRRTKAGREEWERVLAAAEAGGQTVVDWETFNTASAMIVAAQTAPIVADLLNGVHEAPFFWTDPDTGEACKCRLDCWFRDDRGVPVIVDYKTTTDCSERAFLRDVVSYGYFFQAAMYSEGLVRNGMCPRLIREAPRRRWEKDPETGKRRYWTEYPERIVEGGEEGEIIPPRFIFVAQEKMEPYSVNVFELDQDFILAGYDKFRELLGTYHTCKLLDDWPGPLGPSGIPQILTAPGWMRSGE